MSHREFSTARDCEKQAEISKSHLKLPKCDRQPWQITHPCPYCNSSTIGRFS
jgi:hypothetical protein